MLLSFLRYFENRINPFARREGMIPRTFFAYILYFVRQAPVTFTLALILGGLLGYVEITLFGYVGEIVDLLDGASPADVFAEYGEELLWMAFFILVIRTGVMTLSTILDEQVIVPGFFNLVRWQNHRHVIRQSVRFFQNDFAGRIATKVSQSGQSLGDFLISLLQVVWLFVIYVVGALVLFADLHLYLTGIVAVWALAYAAILFHFIPRIRRSAKNLAEGQAVVNGRLVDAYSNITLVKLDGEEEREDEFVADGMRGFIRSIKAYTRNITGMRFSLNAINALMIVSAGYMAISLWQISLMSLGAIAFALGIMLRLVILSQRMLGQFNGLFRAVGTIQNTMETVTQPITLSDREDAYAMPRAEGQIDIRNLRFRYQAEDRQEVIDDLSLSIRSGEKIGLVGPSGAGKSTLVNLILRLHDLGDGEIRIDGHDIRAVTQTSLRRNFGFVQQDSALLNRSIRDNIAYGRPEADWDEVVAAARKAEAHDFILTLADAKGRSGYDAHVGERGVKLSGGQRQRIQLARIILKNAPILILDEATAALDSETEAAISSNLAQLMDGKTVIAIAHRLSTIAAMDRLVVMNEGRIVETGKHEDLLEAKGLYARLWARQSGGFIDASEAAGFKGKSRVLETFG
ncbi:MAG: ABC transporter ATP-binding protein [Pseudomonadota bacterium]